MDDFDTPTDNPSASIAPADDPTDAPAGEATDAPSDDAALPDWANVSAPADGDELEIDIDILRVDGADDADGAAVTTSK